MDMNRSQWVLPGAIVLVGMIFAVAIFVIRDNYVFGPPDGDVSLMRPVSPDEHIIGNPDAPVLIVEYADIDSSYSKEFQRTLAQLMTDYGSSGKVAWVYRHFPLVNQNPNASRHAEAAECVTSLGNATAFWRFIDLLQANAPDDEQFDPRNYSAVVKQLGINVEEFNACMASGKFAAKVEADFKNALDAGAVGSPYTIIRIEGKERTPITGAVPYATLKQLIDSVPN